MKNQLFPMPRVDKVLDNLGHACYFTTLDLASGKYQWGHKTEINLLFAPVKVMPICLINASYTFQKMMQRGLGGLQWQICMVYLDNIIVYSKPFSQHRQNLCSVFDLF